MTSADDVGVDNLAVTMRIFRKIFKSLILNIIN